MDMAATSSTANPDQQSTTTRLIAAFLLIRRGDCSCQRGSSSLALNNFPVTI
jgi:hypothetical protein